MMRRQPSTLSILRHWREAVPNDRLADLVKTPHVRLFARCNRRLAAHSVSFGH